MRKVFLSLLCVQKKTRNKFTGVYFDKISSKWSTKVHHENKAYYCGLFLTELEGAQAVNEKCAELGIPLKNPEIENKSQVGFVYVYFQQIKMEERFWARIK